ncbi:hypothetical protein [Vibrio sonorensis]|uniref:hypothetical protein n=1 Tax=Vibrio sonorensis TaxID=1004316 RepID=UPI0008D8FE83|nr:hypothetical protein [Vibrio sonorensis]
MAVSSLQSGYQILDQSNQMAERAAREINEVASQEKQSEELSFNRVEQTPTPNDVERRIEEEDQRQQSLSQIEPSYTDALVELNQARQYNLIGTNVLQRDQDMIGTLLDIHV